MIISLMPLFQCAVKICDTSIFSLFYGIIIGNTQILRQDATATDANQIDHLKT
jgi:hypothetical protein